jgi:hypothetical protein
LVFSVVLASCSATRKGRNTVNYQKTESSGVNSLEAIFKNNISNNDFNIQKADINVVQDNISVRLMADLKFKKPDSLLITVRSRSGIEAGRAFISRDTLIIKDRVNKKLLIGIPEAIGAKYGIDPSFIFILLGDIVLDEKDRTKSIDCINEEYRKEYMINGKRVEYIVDCRHKKLKQIRFEGDVNTGNITIGLSDIKNTGGIIYPGRIEINDDLKTLGLIIEIKRIASPWTGKMGVFSGQGYKVIRIR